MILHLGNKFTAFWRFKQIKTVNVIEFFRNHAWSFSQFQNGRNLSARREKLFFVRV